uniref:Uncharacterized protein n=1 Tax=Rhizophora mucronata TaxID=61149 RepID=A0A2P2NXB2_RHIMU
MSAKPSWMWSLSPGSNYKQINNIFHLIFGKWFSFFVYASLCSLFKLLLIIKLVSCLSFF